MDWDTIRADDSFDIEVPDPFWTTAEADRAAEKHGQLAGADGDRVSSGFRDADGGRVSPRPVEGR